MVTFGSSCRVIHTTMGASRSYHGRRGARQRGVAPAPRNALRDGAAHSLTTTLMSLIARLGGR